MLVHHTTLVVAVAPVIVVSLVPEVARRVVLAIAEEVVADQAVECFFIWCFIKIFGCPPIYWWAVFLGRK